MPLFQKSVLRKYINELDSSVLKDAFNRFQCSFGNPAQQVNILNSKEEQYQEGFLRHLFVNILGYTLNPDANFNLITEQKNEKDSKKADGAILVDNKVKAVIELKSTKTVDLTSIEIQAFNYKNNQKHCEYVITSNFKKLRFYIGDAVDFEEFDLFNMTLERFKVLWICLRYELLIKDIAGNIKEASNSEEEKITKVLYADYAEFRKLLFQDVCVRNPSIDPLVLFKKTQKLLDRFLFLFFAEDRGLVSPNWTRRILTDWTDLKERYDNYIPLYTRFRKNFDYLNSGFQNKDFEIFAYNGGLFRPDEVLDSLTIDDSLLYNGTLKLSNYDFDSEVDVNILGHIFEHSLNEIDELHASIQTGNTHITKRKKDGVFYTPKYITKYIIESTLGALCNHKRRELEIVEDDFELIDARTAKSSKKLAAKRSTLNIKLSEYREWLLQLKIIDPACGSGAFLNQALEFLISEHNKVDELRARLLGGSIILSDVENSILENNLYGVDINDEAVEIAKLSLWLRTARRGRKLSSLNNNIKCGNSLIDDHSVAKNKAFSWIDAFGDVFNHGGFDAVIGNPPYVPTEYISESEKHYLESTYKSAFGRINLYPIFYEKGIQILKEGGMLGFITPYTLLKNQYFIECRRYIVENTAIKCLIDFSGNLIFKDAAVDSIILILQKDKTKNNSFFQISGVSDFLSGKYVTTLAFQNDIVSKKDLSLILSVQDNLIEKLSNGCLPLKEIVNFKQGIITGGNSKFITKVESDRTKPVLTGSHFNRYTFPKSDYFIVYDTKSLHRPRTPEVFEIEEKIVLRQTGSYPIASIDTSQYYTLDTVHNGRIINQDYDIKYLLALLNSKLIRTIYESLINETGKVFAQVKIIYIDPLPIKMLSREQQQPFIQNVELMFDLHEELIALSNAFMQFISSKLGLEITFKWYLMSDTDFLKTLEKNKIKLTLDEQGNWLTYFTSKKSQAMAISGSISKLDREIDLLVYNLYELSDEEVKIVEQRNIVSI